MCPGSFPEAIEAKVRYSYVTEYESTHFMPMIEANIIPSDVVPGKEADVVKRLNRANASQDRKRDDHFWHPRL